MSFEICDLLTHTGLSMHLLITDSGPFHHLLNSSFILHIFHIFILICICIQDKVLAPASENLCHLISVNRGTEIMSTAYFPPGFFTIGHQQNSRPKSPFKALLNQAPLRDMYNRYQHIVHIYLKCDLMSFQAFSCSSYRSSCC